MNYPDWFVFIALWCWAGMGFLMGIRHQKNRSSVTKVKRNEK